ncbi:MAG: hypothetical protein EXR98_04955 [Gemmataceae bacterium]|nr:hypothetical protein [Gemmataceae bacterium]
MKRLPLLMDDNPSPLVRAAAYLLVPISLTLLLPILLLVILALYVVAIFHGGRYLVFYVTGKSARNEVDMQKLHFLELPAPAESVEHESKSST